MSNQNYNNLSKQDLLEMLKSILDNIEGLPDPAKLTAPTHFDLYAIVGVVYAILRLDNQSTDDN